MTFQQYLDYQLKDENHWILDLETNKYQQQSYGLPKTYVGGETLIKFWR